MFRHLSFMGLCFSGVLLLCGCGGGADTPDLGQVSGVVTLDGQPLEGAVIEFIPQGGRPSSGTTDSEGKYDLRYTVEEDGALIGSHEVRITTAREQTGGEGDQPLVEAREEQLPPKYHTKSELKENVEAGSQTIDFALESA